jgi:peroxiredoxin
MILPAEEYEFVAGGTLVTRTSYDLFGGLRVLLVSVPGAFTPEADRILFDYAEAYPEFKELGIDQVYLVCNQSAYVCDAWADSVNDVIVIAGALHEPAVLATNGTVDKIFESNEVEAILDWLNLHS